MATKNADKALDTIRDMAMDTIRDIALGYTDMARDATDYLVAWENTSTMILLAQLPKPNIYWVLKHVIKNLGNLAEMIKNSSVKEQERRSAFHIEGKFCPR